MNVRFYSSYNIKMILKSIFAVKMLGFCHGSTHYEPRSEQTAAKKAV